MAARKPAPRKGARKKAATRKAAPKKAAAKKATPKRAAKKAAKTPAFGRPGTAGKAEGHAAVKAWIRGVKPEHRPIVERLDAIIGEVVPDVKRAIKWSTPLYGREGQGWFASVASFKEHVGLGFFAGTSLTPQPPFGESKEMRRVNIRAMDELDEAQVRSWVEQAAALKGWGRV